jgi:hypothetical protein
MKKWGPAPHVKAKQVEHNAPFYPILRERASAHRTRLKVWSGCGLREQKSHLSCAAKFELAVANPGAEHRLRPRADSAKFQEVQHGGPL